MVRRRPRFQYLSLAKHASAGKSDWLTALPCSNLSDVLSPLNTYLLFHLFGLIHGHSVKSTSQGTYAMSSTLKKIALVGVRR